MKNSRAGVGNLLKIPDNNPKYVVSMDDLLKIPLREYSTGRL